VSCSAKTKRTDLASSVHPASFAQRRFAAGVAARTPRRRSLSARATACGTTPQTATSTPVSGAPGVPPSSGTGRRLVPKDPGVALCSVRDSLPHFAIGSSAAQRRVCALHAGTR
jgi:hypothetical protein